MKNMLLVVSFFTLSAYAMEQKDQWSITAYDTKINLNKRDMFDNYADGSKKVDFIVVGQQGKHDRVVGHNLVTFYDRHDTVVGSCWEDEYAMVALKDRDGKRSCFCYNLLENLVPLQEGYNACVMVAQPDVWQGSGGYIYNSRRLGDDGKMVCGHHVNDAAIAEALQDVEVCYKNVLTYYKNVLTYAEEKNDTKIAKSIAMPVLGAAKSSYSFNHPFSAEVVAPVAIKAIFEFIKNNPQMYERIELFVEEDSDFVLCKQLLTEANKSFVDRMYSVLSDTFKSYVIGS